MKPADLITIEPAQAIVDQHILVVTAPIADVLRPGALDPLWQRLRAGDEVRLLRFTDADRARLVETATIIITEASPAGVQHAPAGKPAAISMTAPSAKTAAAVVEEKLTVVPVEDERFEVLEEFEPRNKVHWFRVAHSGRTLETFSGPDGRQEAERFCRNQRRSFPAFVVRDAAGADLSPLQTTKLAAQGWMQSELRRRQTARAA